MKIAGYIVIAFLVWNLIVFLLYGLDKFKAQHDKWRISERTLLLSAVFMGGGGALLGMRTFRHKTKKPLFKLGVPAALVLNVLTIAAALYLWYRYIHS